MCPLLRQAAVIGVVFVTFLIGFSGERPDLLAQPVAVVILMLRLQSDGAAGLHGAPDQSAQGVIGIAIDNPPGHVLFLRKQDGSLRFKTCFSCPGRAKALPGVLLKVKS